MSKLWITLVFGGTITVAAIGTCLAQTGTLPPMAPNIPVPAAPAAPPPAPVTAPPAALAGQSLYNGGAVGDNGVGVAPWGGGAVSEDDAHSIANGQHSLLLESPSFYQGGAVTFAQPVSLGDTTDQTKYLQVTIMLTADPKYPPPAPPASPANGPDQTVPTPSNSSFDGNSAYLFKLAQMSSPPGYPMGPGNGPGGSPGGPTQDQGAPSTGYTPETAPTIPPLPAQSLHMVLTFADGSQTDIERDLPSLEDVEPWIDISVPLCKLVLAPGTSAPRLAALTLATDSPCLINVGRIRLISDSSPITASTGGEKDISVNEQAIFKAAASGGASMLNYVWDFETEGKFVPQADTPLTTHTYTTPGVYKVTLIVSDVDGIKAPATATTTVHVEQ